jgi:iron complex transport system permease protein
MGDDEAQALGVPVAFVRYSVIVAATLVSALTVSIAGMIGWIGLFIPHFARLLIGPSNVGLIAASAAFGTIFLLAADAAARSMGAVEVPIGIITELLGIPAFLLVLSRARKSWM